MKILLPISVACASILMACGGTKPLSIEVVNDRIEETQNKTITQGSVSIDLFTASRMDTIASTINYEFYTKPSTPAEDSVNYIIQRFVKAHVSFGEYAETNTMLSDQYMAAALDSFEYIYLDDLSQYEEGDYFGGIWSVDISNSINESHKEFIYLTLAGWSYMGGAHGNGVSFDVLIDRKTGNVLELADFFTNLEELTSIAEVIFRTNQELDSEIDLNEAGFWFENGKFALNENFNFNAETLEFLYNPYEIAPYSAGSISLSIPRAKINHLLIRNVD